MTRPFTVTVDARVVFDEERRGIAKTTVALYRTMAMLRPNWRFWFFYKEGVNDNPFADVPNISVEQLRIKGDRYELWPRVRLPVANLMTRPDIFHAPAGPAPWVTVAPMVTTIHDLIPLETGRTDPDTMAWIANVRRAARRSRLILAVSRHGKERIVQHFGIAPEKIRVVHWGPINGTATPLTPDCQLQLRERFGLHSSKRYVLHFGMADPRKNTARLIAAWSQLPGEIRRTVSLVIVGVAPSARDSFCQQVIQHNLDASVGIHGYVSDDDVAALLAGATVMAYPTQSEGFGLPILDAFAAGVPVLTGNQTSLPEVAGDAAVLVDPTNTGSITDGLQYLLTDTEFCQQLIRNGRDRLTRFDWHTTAERVATMFEEIARG